MNTQTKYTSDFVPVKAIANGTIILDNNEKVTGVKIEPRNIFISDAATQEAVINNLQNVYNIIDYEFWLIAADRPVDIKVYLSQLQLLYNQTTNPVKRKMIMTDIDKANSFTHNNVVDTEFYLLFKEKDIDKAQKKIRTLVNSFAGAGLLAAPVSNEDLRIILDNFLNGGQTTSFGTVMS
jgi:hypothetical protein